MMVVRLVTFDFTRTLSYINGNVGSIYAEVANRYYLAGSGVVCDPVDVLKCFKRGYYQVSKEIPCFGYFSNTGSEGWWYEVVERTLMSSGLRDRRFLRSIANQLYTDFSTDKHWRLYPDVKSTLMELHRKGIRLGVISNFDVRLPTIMEYLGIRDSFDFVLCSGIIGIEKPSLEIFKTALALADVSAEQAIHVGDDEEMDYRPPKTIGMQSFLIRRNKTPENPVNAAESQPDSIKTLKQLIDISS